MITSLSFVTEPSEEEQKLKKPGVNTMSNNLDLLRQQYCGPATVIGEKNHYLFPLEKECDEGKMVMAHAPVTPLQVQQFDPSGLDRTYRDSVTGAELPVFAVFNLEGARRCSFEITSETPWAVSDPGKLQSMIPLRKSQPFVRKINEWRTKADRITAFIAGFLGILPAIAFILSPMGVAAGEKVPFVFLGGWLLGAMLVYVLTLSFLDRFHPWKKLVITAEFNGLLPKETRERALAARGQFDDLYLVVDQENRWESELLPDPVPRALDPLLIGEVNQAGELKHFLIDQFDLTEAEKYLADEFAIKIG
jgi:hypothetical protein